MRGMGQALFVAAAVVVGALFAAPAASDVSAAKADGGIEKVRSCMAANQPETTTVQRISLETIDGGGSKTSSEARVYWQKTEDGHSNVLLRFFDPPDMRSAGLLILEKAKRSDMWVYLPEIGKIRRVSKHMARGSLFGSDFTIEEFERLYGMASNAASKRLPDQEVDGRPVYIIEELHTDESSAYARTVLFVDHETCVPLRSESYEVGDRLRKVITVKPEDLRKAENLNYAEKVVAHDLRDATESRIVVKEISVGEKIPRRTFGQHFLETSRN